MITPEEKTRIARENGKKSHGPITPEGKEKVSQSSVRHGFFSKRMTAESESYANQSPDCLQYACFQPALNKLEKLRRRKEPLPYLRPQNIEKEFPENSPEAQSSTSTNIEIEQANQPLNPEGRAC